MAAIDAIQVRLLAIVGGTYPVGSPYIPAGTFTLRAVHLPHANPSFPSTAVLNRDFDLLWQSGRYDGTDTDNTTDGPLIRRVAATLRVQYKVTLPAALVPRDKELALGAETAARARAADDGELLAWALGQPAAWSGVCPGLVSIAWAVEKVDAMRVLLSVPLVWLREQSAVTSPGVVSIP